MIENYNETKMPVEGEVTEFKKYIGVGSINVVAVNPSNDKLRSLGWNVPENAEEPKYIYEKLKDGKPTTSTKIRLMVQIQDLEDKPVIPIDFWIGQEVSQNATGNKAKIIDDFGRTAWATAEDIKAKRIPEYSNGPASISSNYRYCHRGEEELVRFVFKYMNVTPLQQFDRATNSYVNTKKPGKFAFDSWKKLCMGDVSELKEIFSLKPNNCVKVIFGVTNTDDNKTYQTFLNSAYLGNGMLPDKITHEYPAARKAIDKYMERTNRNETFSAESVKPWTVSATTEVKDNSTGSMFDNDGNFIDDDSDLPL